ncbi:PTS system, mannitol-specific IIBC component [Spiroplasma gladiatoris]|uniref:PTS system, mannitol-specific IIBC component n=1 Tax=Spiroplasma gladiatoris TaxID=2143 RepID=A0A4P7AGG3_9MOLU|nr:PTS mannitol transporter subunit IICB [Spiroplasma gladiatoris]QBQ07464.1 PTS system, mannitol-specific IIBC component [Spiroplasma gladiatoris]
MSKEANFVTKKDVSTDNDKNAKQFRVKLKKVIQKAGSFMAGMVMPTVSLLIAWGILAAAFLGKMENGVWVKTGWFNSQAVGEFIGPTMKYLIPVLIGYTAGNMIYKVRGAMLSAFVTFALIIGSDWLYNGIMSEWPVGDEIASKVGAPNQIIGAMIVAPLSAYLYKKLEILYIDRVKPGYEMLVRNFSLALWAIVFSMGAYFSWGFGIYGLSYVMTKIISLFTKLPWLFPFMSIVTEPLRAVFLNNALNYGVMIPLGLEQVKTSTFSGFFMVGGNPGPGFGLLIAFTTWRKKQRAAAGGSSIIQLIGGIHEVHYVYILAEPIMILSTISGAFASLAIVALFNGGAIAPISPGSLISVISMSGSGMRILINICAVFAGALVSFGVASFIMIFKRKKHSEVQEIVVTDEGIDFNEQVKKDTKEFNFKNAKLLMVACDAGVGSSAMAAGILKKWVTKNNVNIEVKNCAVKDLTTDVDIVVTMINFKEVAMERSPNAYIYTVKQYLGKNIFDDLQTKLLEAKEKKDE